MTIDIFRIQRESRLKSMFGLTWFCLFMFTSHLQTKFYCYSKLVSNFSVTVVWHPFEIETGIQYFNS